VKRKLIAAVGIAGMIVGVTACGSSSGGSSASSAPKSITVWLTTDAQNNWPDLVAAADKAFEKQHPGVTVKHEYYSWTDKNPKLNAVLATNSVPDVVEMGNTETLSYILQGAFAPVNPSNFDNSATWLAGLKGSVSYNGKVYGVPYYAGGRVAFWRKDIASAAGVSSTPTSWSELNTDLGKIQSKEGNSFSAWYQPSRDWYAAMSFVYDAGGAIATQSNGQWKGALESPQAIKGLQTWLSIENNYMHGDKTKDESDRPIIYGQGKSAMIWGAAWEGSTAVADDKTGGKLKTNLTEFALPSPNGGNMPVFLGGSDLVIPAKSKAQDLAASWINDFTGNKGQQGLMAKGNLPNNTTQLVNLQSSSNPVESVPATAAAKSWFTPAAPGWDTVESEAILQNMLQSIATGKASVQAAAASADNQINQVINNK
jgi:N,N'-diacetylchitobiose transport system substrate-binding protein